MMVRVAFCWLLLCGTALAQPVNSFGIVGVSSLNTRSGAVTLLSADVSAALGFAPAPLASPSFTGTVYASSNLANYLSLAGGGTGAGPTITAVGSDANISLSLAPKGTGIVSISTGDLILQTGVLRAPSAAIGGSTFVGSNSTNFFLLQGAATGSAPTFSAWGGDANIDISLVSKGTGKVVVSGALMAGSSIKTSATTVAGLGTCNAGLEGTRWGVTDATAPTFLGTLTGGGAVHAPAYCNGTAWVAG